MKFKILKELSVSDGDNECAFVKIENKNSKFPLLNCCCRPPSGPIKELNSYLENIFKKANTDNKTLFVVVDFSLNCLDCNMEVRTFYNRIFAYGSIFLIKRTTGLTSKTVSLICNIFANFMFDTLLKLKKGIIRSDVSDHFPEFASLNSSSKFKKKIKGLLFTEKWCMTLT